MDVLCSECEGIVQIDYIERITEDYIKIVFVCSCCGKRKTVREYLY